MKEGKNGKKWKCANKLEIESDNVAKTQERWNKGREKRREFKDSSKRDIWDLHCVWWCKNERYIMKHKGIDEIIDEWKKRRSDKNGKNV